MWKERYELKAFVFNYALIRVIVIYVHLTNQTRPSEASLVLQFHGGRIIISHVLSCDTSQARDSSLMLEIPAPLNSWGANVPKFAHVFIVDPTYPTYPIYPAYILSSSLSLSFEVLQNILSCHSDLSDQSLILSNAICALLRTWSLRHFQDIH